MHLLSFAALAPSQQDTPIGGTGKLPHASQSRMPDPNSMTFIVMALCFEHVMAALLSSNAIIVGRLSKVWFLQDVHVDC